MVTIDALSQNAVLLELVTTNNYVDTTTFMLRLEQGYGSFSSSGIYVKYFNIGDKIKIKNINNNTLFYQTSNNQPTGALKINLL